MIKEIKIVLIVFIIILSFNADYILNAQTQLIGSLNWATKNLDVVTFKNGDLIPEAKTNKDWEKLGGSGKPAWCYYHNDESKNATVGKLYNWYAVNDARGIAPLGWHVASDIEWKLLTDELGGDTKSCAKIKAISGWGDTLNNNPNGSNSSGFEALPGGYRYYDGTFLDVSDAFWWTSTENLGVSAWVRTINYQNLNVIRTSNYKQSGLSVRCIQD